MDGLRGGRSSPWRAWTNALNKLREVAGNKGTVAPPDPALVAQFTAAMDNDLNVSGAWGAVFEWVRECNRLIANGQMMPPIALPALHPWEIHQFGSSASTLRRKRRFRRVLEALLEQAQRRSKSP